MRIRSLLFVLALTMTTLSCSKIKFKKIVGYYDIVSWKLTDLSGAEQDGLAKYAQLVGEDNIISITENNEILLISFRADTIYHADNGLWEENDGYNTITFTDSIFLFNQDKPYDIDKLTKDELQISGTYVSGIDSFPKMKLMLEKR